VTYRITLNDRQRHNKTVIQPFFSSRLDYCNALLCVVADDQLSRLQAVKNAVALETGPYHPTPTSLAARSERHRVQAGSIDI